MKKNRNQNNHKKTRAINHKSEREKKLDELITTLKEEKK